MIRIALVEDDPLFTLLLVFSQVRSELLCIRRIIFYQCNSNHWDGVCSGSSYHDNYLFIFPNSKRGKIEKSEGCLITGTLILTFENGLGILKENNR